MFANQIILYIYKNYSRSYKVYIIEKTAFLLVLSGYIKYVKRTIQVS